MVIRREDKLSQEIIGAAIEVHRVLGGPGLLESLYEEALCEELKLRGIPFVRQMPVEIHYKGMPLGRHLVADVEVDGLVLVEVKATMEQHPVYEAQLLTYLRLTNKKLGLVINFGQPLLKDGIHRVVNNL